MNLQITVRVMVDTKVAFLLNPGAEELYPGPPWLRGIQERPKLPKTHLFFRIDDPFD